MRVGLIGFPRKSTLPNIALMRLSAWHKAQGDTVELNPSALEPPDRLYISTLFTWQRRQVEEVAAHFRAHSDLDIGGSGCNFKLRLPEEVDAMSNDYDLFGIDYGIGYSSRGCIRHCAFCPVPRTEGHIREASAIADLLNPQSNRLLFLDNNFFASEWRPKIAEIHARGLHVSWPQGLDIRLVDADQAHSLADLHHHGQLWNQRFTKRGQLHFAWDNPITDRSKAEVITGIRALFDAGFGPNDLIFYVLIGFHSSVGEELERLAMLHELGIQPKVMVYRDDGEVDRRDPVRMDIQHWNDGHVWRKVPFSQYRRVLAS
jgi:hypothetical protein